MSAQHSFNLLPAVNDSQRECLTTSCSLSRVNSLHKSLLLSVAATKFISQLCAQVCGFSVKCKMDYCICACAGILLHSDDSGKTWTRVPLSAKLPGAPIRITALDQKGSAEMATESGAIYVTNNRGDNWKAAVQETVDATLNRTVSSGISGASYYEGSFASIVRGSSGQYVGVSARGNFYMTWSPGDNAWTPHNRPATRRLQNLGWTADDRLWATTRGGDVLIGDEPGVGVENFKNAKIGSRGFGLLDIGCVAVTCMYCHESETISSDTYLRAPRSEV